MVPHTPESRTALHKELSEKRNEGKETENEYVDCNVHEPYVSCDSAQEEC